MWRDFVQRTLRWASHVIQKPRDELSRWQRAARFSYDLARHGIRQLREDRAPQMAAALAYETLFALVPVLVMAMILVRGIIGVPHFLSLAEDLLESLGLQHVTLSRAPAVGAAPETISLQQWIEMLIGQAGQIDMSAVGWIGFAVIVYAAISILVTIEKSFNTIYRAPEGRPWVRRVPLYWFLITASPLAVSLTAILHGRVETWAQSIVWAPWFAVVMGFTWSIVIGWLFWFSVYSLVPNTSVSFRSSAIGALVCVILLEIGKSTLAAYMSKAFSVNPLYSSLGLIPLFMFWVYLMWMAVLFGLEVSATLQFLGDRALEEMETRRSFVPLVDPSVVVSVAQIVGENFRDGHSTSQRQIADRASISERTVAIIVQELCLAGVLHRLEREQNSVCLAIPPEQVMTDRLLEVGFRLADEGGERWVSAFAAKLRDQQLAVAAKTALASLLPTETAKPAAT